MAALIGTALRSVFAHVGRHKMAYGLGAASTGGLAYYQHQKNKVAQAEESPMPEMGSSPTGGHNTDPTKGASYTA